MLRKYFAKDKPWFIHQTPMSRSKEQQIGWKNATKEVADFLGEKLPEIFPNDALLCCDNENCSEPTLDRLCCLCEGEW